MKARCKLTNYGFIYGPCEVTRIHSTENGAVYLDVETEKEYLQIRVTPTGFIRTTNKRKKG